MSAKIISLESFLRWTYDRFIEKLIWSQTYGSKGKTSVALLISDSLGASLLRAMNKPVILGAGVHNQRRPLRVDATTRHKGITITFAETLLAHTDLNKMYLLIPP